eukprot:749490-Hanusia_phi.AAC.3
MAGGRLPDASRGSADFAGLSRSFQARLSARRKEQRMGKAHKAPLVARTAHPAACCWRAPAEL